MVAKGATGSTSTTVKRVKMDFSVACRACCDSSQPSRWTKAHLIRTSVKFAKPSLLPPLAAISTFTFLNLHQTLKSHSLIRYVLLSNPAFCSLWLLLSVLGG